MLDNYLIRYCSPTLASLKSGSLFNCSCGDGEPIEEHIDEWNTALKSRGVSICLLRRTQNAALIYVYRHSAISETLSDPEVQSFLAEYGYATCNCCFGCGSESCSIENCLEHLKNRISSDSADICSGFPHEIGIFLGYPLADVSGFIKNKGRNCKYTGQWKVYGDDEAARKAFAGFEKCSKVYDKLWKSGVRSILQLTVAG